MPAPQHDPPMSYIEAAVKSWVTTPDRSARTAKARAALQQRFEAEADPDGTLPPDERAKRIAEVRRRHYRRLAALATVARREAREAREGAPDDSAA